MIIVIIRNRYGAALENLTAMNLADEILESKNALVALGRKVFKISSHFRMLEKDQKSSLRSLAAEHALFKNPQIIYAQMDEFYKASAGYVELLKELNAQLVALSGLPKRNSKNTD